MQHAYYIIRWRALSNHRSNHAIMALTLSRYEGRIDIMEFCFNIFGRHCRGENITVMKGEYMVYFVYV